MFPEEFVREQTLRHTRRGDLVFDCFSGRGTTALEALLLDRPAAAETDDAAQEEEPAEVTADAAGEAEPTA